MTFTIAIQFPDRIDHWRLQSTDRTAALYAAAELAKPDGIVTSWWPTPQREEWA